jgi:hypothetical protein
MYHFGSASRAPQKAQEDESQKLIVVGIFPITFFFEPRRLLTKFEKFEITVEWSGGRA